MRKVVVNTTPLIALSEIGELHLLRDLYGEIDIPNAVFEEIKSEKAKKEGHIQTVKPIMDKLIRNGLYISNEVQTMVLKAANEQ